MRTMSTALRKIAVLLVSLSLICSMVSPALAADVVSAPLSSASSALNGMVRVYLSSLGSPSTLNVTVAGSYSINGSTSLSNGETVTVSFSSATGAITLTRGGVKTNMGSYFALRRHSASGSNGVKIAQARRPANPYPGDLSFRAVQQSSGSYKLYTVAHVYIEDYLYGVLPYEMGNGASVEALKAQAVAARTYTVRMMNSRSSGYYDVVDTTSDQVYNGTPSGYANCVTAVNATKGVVMMYGSSYTATYYSASNGGQTEDIANIWGSSGYPYLIVKDDPFDYDSPGATVKKATVSTDCASGSTSSALKNLLKSKAVSALNGAGYSATSANTTLRTVVSITPHTPKYGSPSRLYTKLDFALTASTANRSGATVTASVTVTCDIFTELESMLGMSIQSSKNELWTVRETGSSFVLEARRYGHGLGMSQRGAMYMGTLGYSYDQILGFYYPGCKRVSHSFTSTILNPGSSDPTTSIETPVDVTDPTGGCTGVALAALPVRSAKAEAASLLCTVAANSPVRVLSSDGTWCFLQYGEIKGYALQSALSLTGDAPAAAEGETPTIIAGFATVSANGSLNLRSSGSLDATIVGSASSGATLTVLERGAAWSRVQSGALAAYASNEFLAFSDAPAGLPGVPGEPTPIPSESPGTADTAIVATESGSLNLRSEARAGSGILTTIPKGAQVIVTMRGDTWTAVSYNGYNGYVMTVFLAFSGASPTPAPEAGAATTAIVTTSSGSLNLREIGMAGSTILRTIPQYASVTVLQRGAEWCQVAYEGTIGYVMSAFLTIIEPEATPTPSVTPDPSASPSVDPSASPSADPSVSPSVDPSVSPVPSPTPTPAPSAETALVTTGGGSLNLRQEALPGSRILARVPNGSTLVIEEKLSAWCRVSYGGFTGYVMNSYLTFTGETTTITGATTATVLTTSGSLNLRDAPDGGVIARIPQFAVIEVRQRGSAWCYVGYQGLYGYVMTAYLSFAEDAQTPTPAPSDTPSAAPSDTPSDAPAAEGTPAWVLTPSGSLNLREFTSSDAKVMVEIPRLAEVSLLALGDTWCRVQYGTQIGFVMTQYLSMTRPAELDSQAPTPIPEPTPETGTGGGTPVEPPAPVPEDDPDDILTIDPTLAELDTPIEASVSPPNGQGFTYLYVECDEQGALLTELAADEIVAVLEIGDQWCYVSYCGLEGYCLTNCLLGG